ncbi:MAG: hydrolase [Tissierellia bacterium]|nr:hydrolase [Tissierellia bacterium]
MQSKQSKFVPEVKNLLRGRSIKVPESIYKASGIIILGTRIKSLIFTTDVAVIKNSNANSVMAVYPFTPQLSITQAIMEVAQVPVFVGVGGGMTSGSRVINIALQAELLGAYGVVVNAPMKPDVIKEVAAVLDIPIIQTVISEYDEVEKKIEAGVSVLNVAGGAKTPELVRNMRERVGDEFPIIATGGNTDESIGATIAAGANAITYTPPTSSEIFKGVMKTYREKQEKEHGV